MDLLEDPTFKTKYQKSKLRVKLWESDFMEKYGRKPNKNDIREADVTIRDAYKMYWKLKTRALEETLMDITFSDDVQSNISSTSLSTSIVEEKIPLNDTSNVENCKPEILSPKKETAILSPKKETVFEAVAEAEGVNADGVWGQHLNKEKKAPVVKKKPLLVGRSSSFQLSQEKFNSTSFTKRNPRKSLSLVRAKSKSNIDANPSPASQATDGFDTSEVMKPIFGDGKAKVVQAENKPASQSVSAVYQLIDGKANINRKIDVGWLERCSRQNNLEPSTLNPNRLSRTSDSGLESLESSIHSPNNGSSVIKSQPALPASDDEDFICNSDSEGERRNKRVRNIKGLKSGESQAFKRQRLDTTIAIQTCLQASQEYLSQQIRPAERKVENEKEAEQSEPISHSPETQKQEIDREEQSIPEEDGTKNSDSEPQASATKETMKNVSKPPKGRRKVYRRIKDDETDDSDSENTKEKKVAVKPRKTRATRASTRKQSTKNSKKIYEVEPVDEKVQTEAPVRPIFGVETVDAVPRFALPKSGTGDLVADFSQAVAETDSMDTQAPSTGTKKKTLTSKERLEQKIASGNINENFVRINLKKKVFVRGKKTNTFQKYKKNQWKQKKKELASGDGGLDLADLVEKKGVLTCFKCGDIGHFSKECKALKSDELLPLIGDEGPSEYPTLDEAAKMASETVYEAHRNRLNLIPQTVSQSLRSQASKAEEKNTEEVPSSSNNGVEAVESNDENFDDVLDDLDFAEDMEYNNSETPTPAGHDIPANILAQLLRPESGPVEPLYPIGSSGELSVTPDEVFETLRKFGHESFRPGQEKAVMRILSGQSTLVTLSTGSGKSLCYQLPAYLYAKHSRCITLVISPLVSLMDDQVTGVPKFLSAACLHTAQAAKQRTKVMDMVKDGTLDILLVSPEAVVAGEKSTGFGALLRQLPPIAFACIDEAHCISQWSHNFRPSYLMVCKVLREKLGVKTVLGLTATATKSTAESIVNHLSIPDGMAGVISDTPLPRNLTLTVSRDDHRDRALVALLESDRFKNLDSIIVYCTRRDECVRLAGLLRTSLFDTKKSNVDEKVSSVAEAYHAGLSAHRRKTVQKAFMGGDTRIVVATVAFGMGINKPDIRAVIHYNMPSSFEGYVQEVGRAGRDGLPAHCHLFISPQEAGDKSELRRHIYANGVDRHMVRRLLQKVFVPCSCTKNTNKKCPGHEVAIEVDEIVELLDIPQEIISTLLCYLELHPKKFITTLPSVYVNAKVTSYNGPKALKAAAQSSPPLAMAIALDLKRGISHEDSSIVEFPVVDIAAAIGWDSGVVKGHLKNLEWKTTETGGWKRTPISVTFDTLGFRVRAPGDLSNTELDYALEALTERTSYQQKNSLCQLEAIHSALNQVALDSVRKCRELDEDVIEKSDTLKTTIRAYFQTEDPIGKIDLKLETKLANEGQIANDVRSLVSCYRDNNFTGRAVARIFHGIQSPNYPALVWSRCRLWRAHLSSNFDLICQVATREILAMR